MATSVRVGVDVASVAAVEASLVQHGDAYLRRAYTPREMSSCGTSAAFARRLAGRFAAKEAVVKTLALTDEPVDLREIEIGGEQGRPDVALTGHVAEVARRAGLVDISVSISLGVTVASAIALGSFDAAVDGTVR